MEFPFNINSLLPETITLIRSKDLSLSGHHRTAVFDSGILQKQQLAKVVDKVGAASSKAQGLNGVITSALKLQSSDHHLYILKDADANNGLGAVVGILRVGHKKLYLVDIFGVQHECKPLCVLDFYIHESRQRNGCGTTIFKHMIENESVHPQELAIDRPSPKFTAFLAKHYGLTNSIPQMNKFLVFDTFFKDLSAVGAVDRQRSAPLRRPFSKSLMRPVSRQAISATVSSDRSLHNDTVIRPKKQVSHLSKYDCVPPINSRSNARKDCSGYDTNAPITSSNEEKSSNSNENSFLNPSNNGRVLNSPMSEFSKFSRHISNATASSHLQPLNNVEKRQKAGNQASLPKLDLVLAPGYQKGVSPEKDVIRVENNAGTSSCSSDSLGRNQRLAGADENGNYTLGEQINTNRRPVLGTSWNIFGVPGNRGSSNPYSRFDRRGFPR